MKTLLVMLVSFAVLVGCSSDPGPVPPPAMQVDAGANGAIHRDPTCSSCIIGPGH